MLLPVTAHSAFRKGAWLFDVDVIDIGVDAEFKADAAAMIDAMDDRTALAVVSAPSYAHGVVDPVAQVAAAAAERDILCHLDLCIGGWVLPFIREAEGLPPVDMSIPGVTSASMDLHKYGYAPKGVSDPAARHPAAAGVPLFRRRRLARLPAGQQHSAVEPFRRAGRGGVGGVAPARPRGFARAGSEVAGRSAAHRAGRVADPRPTGRGPAGVLPGVHRGHRRAGGS